MSSNTSPSSGGNSGPASTRQLLDDLDALMQRMLALPVNQSGPEKLPEPLGRTGSLDRPSRPAPLVAVPPRENPELRLEESESASAPPTPAVLPFRPSAREPAAAAPPPSAAAPVSVSREQLLDEDEENEEDLLEKSELLGLPKPVGRELFQAFHTRPEPPEMSDSPALIVQPRTAKPARLPRPAPPAAHGWLTWVNRFYETGTYLLGPLGRWLRSTAGRNVLGWCGVLMLATAVCWQVLLWCGWL